MVADFDEVEKFGHFLIEELDTAAARWLAYFVFMVRAVEVDVALVAVAVVALVDARFEAFEPEDTCRDEVGALFLCTQLVVAFSDADAAFEDFANGGICPDLLGDSMQAGRSAFRVLEVRRRL